MEHANEAVTYYALDRDGRAGAGLLLRGVSWTCKTVATATDKGLQLAGVVVCRLPLENVPEGFIPKNSDILVRGVCEAADCSEAELRKKYNGVTVKAVSDNRDGLAPHWKLEAV